MPSLKVDNPCESLLARYERDACLLWNARKAGNEGQNAAAPEHLKKNYLDRLAAGGIDADASIAKMDAFINFRRVNRAHPHRPQHPAAHLLGWTARGRDRLRHERGRGRALRGLINSVLTYRLPETGGRRAVRGRYRPGRQPARSRPSVATRTAMAPRSPGKGRNCVRSRG